MADFTVIVTYDPTKTPKFSYTDPNGNSAEPRDRCNGGDRIQWKLANNSKASNLKIHFPSHRNPFEQPTTDPVPDRFYKFNVKGKHDPEYKYSVSVKDTASKQVVPDDPHIMFDDGLFGEGTERFGFPDPDKIATAAAEAWGSVFDKLTTSRDVEGASAIQFYPHGITNIEVSVGFEGVTITVQVSGPNS
jgi:hypothetical protein